MIAFFFFFFFLSFFFILCIMLFFFAFYLKMPLLSLEQLRLGSDRGAWGHKAGWGTNTTTGERVQPHYVVCVAQIPLI